MIVNGWTILGSDIEQIGGAQVEDGDVHLILMMAAASFKDPVPDMVTLENHIGSVGLYAACHDGWTVRLGCDRSVWDVACDVREGMRP